jgi:mRNA interferase MazF
VLVPFPFSDLSQTKIRPAVCLANAGRGDWFLCQITSNAFGDPKAIAVKNTDFTSGSLRIDSFARPGKLFTAHQTLLTGTVGVLKQEAFAHILKGVVALFGQ